MSRILRSIISNVRQLAPLVRAIMMNAPPAPCASACDLSATWTLILLVMGLEPMAHPWPALAKRVAEPHLHRKAGRDGGGAVGLRSARLAVRRGIPAFPGAEPDRHRAMVLERVAMGRPDSRSREAGACRPACVARPPRQTHKTNPYGSCATWPCCSASNLGDVGPLAKLSKNTDELCLEPVEMKRSPRYPTV